ncbi:MAG: hypothetical protein KJ970_06535 [Candidatus Eisenbacteria bacterium]|uniref:Fibronectin type-III domain-containing protein n=1 Tax=Eiseniibacteriota bacterium TaxID=2212470 RepID=A0A948RVQ2_UNCEI|nr:hypothetical protein [Candidatus Eisenbacteria bacterium]MBU1948237.1 hypothetical protein [Candidatus Eisenbacteria bacterium]MBU2690569.1 hypothetical protein [Candidatus Eisenbacteria bacterium]
MDRRTSKLVLIVPTIFLLIVLTQPSGLFADEDHAAPWWARSEPVPMPQASDTTVYSIVTGGNEVGLSLFNNGFFGNNLANRSPSLEYPLGSSEDHLVRAGPWVGGIKPRRDEDGVYDSLVTTATTDGTYGSFSSEAVSEFYPADTIGFIEKSILPNSRYFSRDAKSEQDLIATYFDRHGHASEYHKPLGIKIEQEVLQFSFEPFDAIILVNFKIINVDPILPIYDLYMGFYAEFTSGWKDGHSEWPPSGWFKKKDIAYVDSLRLFSEHHYNLDNGNCPSWAGLKLLGIRGPTEQDTVSTKRVSFNWWDWDPNGNLPGTPDVDVERYQTLSNGSIDATSQVEAPNHDPVSTLSVGPLGFAAGHWPDSLGGGERFILDYGDTVTVSFALIGGEPVPHEGRSAAEDLAFNAKWAQTAFDLNFNIPVPPPSPDLWVIPNRNRITLRWTDIPESFIDPKTATEDFEGYRIYVSETKEMSDFKRVREFDLVDSVFYNTSLDEIVADPIVVINGEDTLTYTYAYDITEVRDGFKYWVALTSFDTGTPEVASLESGTSQNRTMVIPGARSADETGTANNVIVFPNPYRGDAVWDGPLSRDRYLWFINLPSRCTIRITTLAGDLVDTIDFDGGTYNAQEIRGIFDPTDPRDPDRDLPILSGGMAAWDLISKNDQGIATGLYLFSVKDHNTGKTQVGKFLILE